MREGSLPGDHLFSKGRNEVVVVLAQRSRLHHPALPKHLLACLAHEVSVTNGSMMNKRRAFVVMSSPNALLSLSL